MSVYFNDQPYDLAIVGAGIIGQALAYHAAKRGMRVGVFERSGTPLGASIRNFGLIWPIGQPTGPRFQMALESLRHWEALAGEAGLDLRRTGSLHLAYRDEEMDVLEDFVANYLDHGHQCRLIGVDEVGAMSQVARLNGLKGALWSGTECQVSSPQALPRIAQYLQTKLGVLFHWHHAVTAVEHRVLSAGGAQFRANRIVVCPGADLDTLFPKLLQGAGLRPVRLQMLAAQPARAQDLGPALCAGLTLLHYPAFERCAALPSLRKILQTEAPEAIANGVHILLSQHVNGEFIIGDSHDYDPNPSPFNSDAVDAVILRYLADMTVPLGLRITRRWEGVYVNPTKGESTLLHPEDGVWIITGLGGAGMTLSLGLTAKWMDETFEA